MAEGTRNRAPRRGFGTVRVRTNGRYQVRYINSSGKAVSGGTFATREKAEAELDRQQRSVAIGQDVDPKSSRRLLVSFVDDWKNTRVADRPSTRKRDDVYLRSLILPTFGGHRLNQISYMDIKKWVANLTTEGYAPETVRKAQQILRKILRDAVRAKALPINPADGVETPRVEVAEMRVISHGQIKTLAEAIDPRYRAAVILFSYGGLRAGELFGLRWRKIDLAHKTVRIDTNLVEVGGHLTEGPPKTNKGKRTISLSPNVVSALDEHLAQSKSAAPSSFVFPSPSGHPVRLNLWRRRFWYPACVEADLGEWLTDDGSRWTSKEDGHRHYSGLRIHDLRHTAITLWLEHGAHPKLVADRAGHESVKTVLDRYVKTLPQSDERLNAALALAADDAAAASNADVAQLATQLELRARDASTR